MVEIITTTGTQEEAEHSHLSAENATMASTDSLLAVSNNLDGDNGYYTAAEGQCSL